MKKLPFSTSQVPCGARCQAPGARGQMPRDTQHHPGARSHSSPARCQESLSTIQVPGGARCQVPLSTSQVPGARCQAPLSTSQEPGVHRSCWASRTSSLGTVAVASGVELTPLYPTHRQTYKFTVVSDCPQKYQSVDGNLSSLTLLPTSWPHSRRYRL